jgi:hypothetical protein
MGRVGRRVGHIAAGGFGMGVIYNDLLDVSGQLDYPARPVEKPTLYRECDVLTIHVDMRAGNENLVGAAQFEIMKPSAILINASRGEVLDAFALAQAIREKRLFRRGAGRLLTRAAAGGFSAAGIAERAAYAAPGQPHLDRDAEYELGRARRDRGARGARTAVAGGVTSIARAVHAAAGVFDLIEKNLTQFRPARLAL